MFQFPAFAFTLSVNVGIAPDGLPHSEIRGSGDICSSPRLIAACHVLLRLREPRHPPCALRPFRFIFMDARARLVSYLFSPCLFTVQLSLTPCGARSCLTALVVFYFMSFCLLARGPRSEACAPSRFPLLPALSLCSFHCGLWRSRFHSPLSGGE